MNKIIWCYAISTFLGLVYAKPAMGNDITDLVINKTQLDEKISQACVSHCHGNRRRGKLERFLLEKTGPSSFFARAEVSLRNYHHVPPPRVFGERVGRGFKLYDYTITGVAEGTLDENSCNLKIENINLENDRLGLSSIAKGQVGKTYHIDECQRFTEKL